MKETRVFYYDITGKTISAEEFYQNMDKKMKKQEWENWHSGRSGTSYFDNEGN